MSQVKKLFLLYFVLYPILAGLTAISLIKLLVSVNS